jgi:hypothetical protein
MGGEGGSGASVWAVSFPDADRRSWREVRWNWGGLDVKGFEGWERVSDLGVC